MSTIVVFQGIKAVGFVAVEMQRMWEKVPAVHRQRISASMWKAVSGITEAFFDWLLAQIEALFAKSNKLQVKPTH